MTNSEFTNPAGEHRPDNPEVARLRRGRQFISEVGRLLFPRREEGWAGYVSQKDGTLVRAAQFDTPGSLSGNVWLDLGDPRLGTADYYAWGKAPGASSDDLYHLAVERLPGDNLLAARHPAVCLDGKPCGDKGLRRLLQSTAQITIFEKPFTFCKAASLMVETAQKVEVPTNPDGFKGTFGDIEAEVARYIQPQAHSLGGYALSIIESNFDSLFEEGKRTVRRVEYVGQETIDNKVKKYVLIEDQEIADGVWAKSPLQQGVAQRERSEYTVADDRLIASLLTELRISTEEFTID